MSKTCNNCGETKAPSTVPYQVLADFKEMHKATVKKLWIALIIAWVTVLAVVGVFTYERLQYDYVGEEFIIEAEQDGEGVNIVGGGNVDYGAESKDNPNS
jgi:hypothetical protein